MECHSDRKIESKIEINIRSWVLGVGRNLTPFPVPTLTVLHVIIIEGLRLRLRLRKIGHILEKKPTTKP